MKKENEGYDPRIDRTVKGTPRRIHDRQIIKHFGIFGGSAEDRAKHTCELIKTQIVKGRPFAIFDRHGFLSDCTSKSLENLKQWVTKSGTSILRLDTEELSTVRYFNPYISLQKELPKILKEATVREGFVFKGDPATEELLDYIAQFSKFFARSLFIKSADELNFNEILAQKHGIIVQISKIPGSTAYGMLLFYAFIKAARQKKMIEPYLVFVDDIFSFVPSAIIASAKEDDLQILSKHNTALIFCGGYENTELLKTQSPKLVRFLLKNFGTIAALAPIGEPAPPSDIIKEIFDVIYS